jgi:hypothetical protein
MMQVTAVLPKDVEACWDSVVKYVDLAADFTEGRYDTNDIREAIENGGHTLWVCYDPYDGVVSIKGVVVTTFAVYPQKKLLFLEFIGGEDGFEWKDVMLETLRKWAADNDCVGIESVGRPGWSRVFKDEGYKQIGYFYELPLETAIGV